MDLPCHVHSGPKITMNMHLVLLVQRNNRGSSFSFLFIIGSNIFFPVKRQRVTFHSNTDHVYNILKVPLN